MKMEMMLILNYDSFVSSISVNVRKVLCRKAFRIFVFLEFRQFRPVSVEINPK